MRRPPITPAQKAELRDHLVTARCFQDIAQAMGLHYLTVSKHSRPIIAEMRDRGVLGNCACGKDRFHASGCIQSRHGSAVAVDGQIRKRAAIAADLMSGRTLTAIADRWCMSSSSVQKYLDFLTPDQREERRHLLRARMREELAQRQVERAARKAAAAAQREPRIAFRPFRDETYARIAAAVPRWVGDATRDDAISDLYLAVLEGAVEVNDITAEARRYAARAVAQFENRFGPRSLDERLFQDSDTTFGDMLVDPAALAAFDHIFEEAR